MEVRAEGESEDIFGTAAVVDIVTDIGWFEEKISKGAFDDV